MMVREFLVDPASFPSGGIRWRGFCRPELLIIGTNGSLFTFTSHYGNMVSNAHRLFCTACTVLIFLACAAAGCSSSPAPSSAPAQTASSQTAAPGENSITIKNFAFDPATLTVKSGTAVTWVNNDGAPHAIVSDNGAPVSFSSDSLATGGTYTFTFTQAGTYAYHCSIHPSMTGTVNVK
jgi:plastocyanin